MAISSRALASVSLKRRPDGGISILDDSFGIDWRIPTEHANLSEKDTKHQVLKLSLYTHLTLPTSDLV